MRIHIGSDHAGYTLKEELRVFLGSLSCAVEDHGPHRFDATDDYPDFIAPTAKAVSEDPGSVGIVIGGSGQGEAIVANKIPGIRAAVYYGQKIVNAHEVCADIVTLSRQHNDANILSLGARFLTIDEAKSAVKCWINTPFSGDERHVKRIEKIKDIENNV